MSLYVENKTYFFTCYCLQQIFESFKAEKIPVIEMSTLTEEGVMNVKTQVCTERKLPQYLKFVTRGQRLKKVRKGNQLRCLH